MRSRGSFSAAEARRAILHAQGFGARVSGEVSHRHVHRMAQRIGMIQIDSVNVLVRAHYLPAFSRLGAYPIHLLEELSYSKKRRRLFEYWGHEACLMPLEHFPLLQWRMGRARDRIGIWKGLAEFAAAKPDFIEQVFEILKENGACSGGEVATHVAEERAPGQKGWWGWSDSKAALEFLFWSGRITTVARRNFERIYDLVERVIPEEILRLPVPPAGEAQRKLVAIGARAIGIGTEVDLREYFRLPASDARLRVQELVESGELLPVTVDGQNAFMHRETLIPRKIDAQALVSPFDPLIWDRGRPERFFGFRYRIEIYTPAHRREHGYYVLPFLFGDRLVARVDLKAERKTRALKVLSVLGEPGIDGAVVAAALADELILLAAWIGLRTISVSRRGNLAFDLTSSLKHRGTSSAPE